LTLVTIPLIFLFATAQNGGSGHNEEPAVID
jgi:hypothetical protein